jgi:hypothetical protein
VNTQQKRLVENEELFREANEKVAELGRSLEASGHELTPFLCECAEPRCTRVLRLTSKEYEAVRAHPSRFVVLPGHEHPDERVVAESERYAVVEKANPLQIGDESG